MPLRLAKLTLRTLALDPALAVKDVRAAQVSTAGFVPRSEAKGAWVSLTAGTCTAFEAAAGSYEPPMLARELSAVLADAAVSDLFELRNVQYHRWRGESPGVTGVNLQGTTMREMLDHGRPWASARRCSRPTPRGAAVVDELVAAGHAALDALVGRLPRFHRAGHAAFQGVFD